MYSYDKSLNVQFTLPAAGATSLVPASMIGELSKDAARVLNSAVVLGIFGRVTTVGDLMFQFGDGTTVDKYGTFTLDTVASAANGPIRGKLVLTEAGYLINDGDPASGNITVTATGTGVLAGAGMVVGYF